MKIDTGVNKGKFPHQRCFLILLIPNNQRRLKDLCMGCAFEYSLHSTTSFKKIEKNSGFKICPCAISQNGYPVKKMHVKVVMG